MNHPNKHIYLIVTVGIINLILLYFIKYSSNQLNITDLDVFKTGNFINLILTSVLCLGAILILSSKIQIHIGHLRTLSLLSILYLTPLFLILLFNSLSLEFKDDYFIGYPLKKIVPVLFYIVNQLIFLFVLFILWYIYVVNNFLAYFYSVLSVAILIIFFLLVSVIYTFFIKEYTSFEVNKKYDYGIILGAAVWSNNRPSPIFRGRIEKGANLYLQNIIDRIQLTGGNAPGEVSEAIAAKNYLIEKYNIRSKDIFIEETTSTTNEQIRYVRNNFLKNDNQVKFIIISDEFHLKRVEEMIDFYDINAKVVSSEYKLNFQKSLYYRLRDSVGLILFWFFAI